MSETSGGEHGRAHGANASSSRAALFTLLLATACLLTSVLLGLGHPLIWQDEGETVMFGQRVLEHGYPRVHDGRNVVYGMGVPLEHAVVEADDAYIGSLWGQYYFAAIGVALAEGVADPWARTARLRVPFALAGLLGLALLFLAVRPVWPRGTSARLWSAALYAALLATSTSLILHVREVRYYALVILLVGASCRLGLRGAQAVGSAALQCVCLVVLFNVFYPAAVAVALWLGVEALLRVVRRPGAWTARVAPEIPLGVALGLTALACAPFALYFEIVPLSRVMSARWQFGVGTYVENLGYVLRYLIRFEYLVPVALVHGGLALTGARRAGLQASWTADSLLRLCVVLALIGARNPIYFERYFVALSPLLVLVMVLDAGVLARAVAERRPVPLAVRGVAGLVVVSLLGVWFVKVPELTGYWHQLRAPYRGPLDHVIPDLMVRYEEPSSLTIATNYEAEAYMYYLGSRVVGRFHDADPEARAEEAAVRVDVVVPRRGQPKNLAALQGYVEPGRFVRQVYPVADLPYNNIPELDPGRVLTMTHRFRSSDGEGEAPLEVYFRREAASPGGG